jgi:hypothetical protein
MCRPSQDLLAEELGLTPNVVVFADFDSELGSHSRSYVGRGGLRCTW